MKPRWLSPWSLAGIAALLAAWQGAALAYHSVLVPGPYDTLCAGIANAGTIAEQMAITLRRAATAFSLSVVTMVPLGIVGGRIRTVGLYLDPLLEFVAAIPPAAVIPLAMLLAGVGDAAKIAVTCYACIPNIVINTMEGVRSVSPTLDRAARSFRLSRLEMMTAVDLPAALPAIVTGLRLAVGTSLLVSITSEMLLATNGIGTFLQSSQENFEVAAGLAGLATLSIVGLAINVGLRRFEMKLLFWYYRPGSA